MKGEIPLKTARTEPAGNLLRGKKRRPDARRRPREVSFRIREAIEQRREKSRGGEASVRKMLHYRKPKPLPTGAKTNIINNKKNEGGKRGT